MKVDVTMTSRQQASLMVAHGRRAQSTAYRANFGFAEASGNAAELMVRVYDTASQLLATIPVAIIFVIFQRYFVRDANEGAEKG